MKLSNTFGASLLLAALTATTGLAQNTSLQTEDETSKVKWYFGIAEGLHVNYMDFSDIDDNMFPDDGPLRSNAFSIFLMAEFGKQKQFGIRPQVTWLSRGGKLTDIAPEMRAAANEEYFQTYGEEGGYDDIVYRLKSRYVDIRVPLIYNFCKADAWCRPYVMVAPVLGISTGGHISLQENFTDGSYMGVSTELSEANFAKTYFAGQVGLGVKFAIPVADTRCYLGVEAAYEYGFTDTYGDKEKDGEAIDLAGGAFAPVNYDIKGDRKFSGFEVSAVLSVPFDVFKKRRPVQPVVVERIVERVVEAPKEEPKEEKPCYTLEEINILMAQNESIEGKTICAIDAVTFDYAKSTIRSESYEYLDKLAATITRANLRVEVKGHTDNMGGDDFNLNLSRERAEAVMNYLVSKGVNRNKLTYSYYGKTRPLTTNDTEEGRATNRRVEFTILTNY